MATVGFSTWLEAICQRYTGNPDGFGEFVVRHAEQELDAALKAGNAKQAMQAATRYEDALVLTGVITPKGGT